jgi:LmbE family N-acetylglucosaminyl deacetylase
MDDAFLSLGGYMLTSRNDQRVKVIDVFSYDPWCIGELGSKEERIATRKAEEQANAESLSLEIVYWDLPAAWRERGYAHWSDLRDELRDAPMIQDLQARIEAEVVQNDYSRILAPLGVGGHIDHLICRDIAAGLARRYPDVEWCFYEDLPYALEPAFWRRVTGFFSEWRPRPFAVDISNWVGTKRKLLATYRSQLTATEMDLVVQYASRWPAYVPEWLLELLDTNQTIPVERLWTVGKRQSP